MSVSDKDNLIVAEFCAALLVMISSGKKVESVDWLTNCSLILSQRILLDFDVIWRFITKVFCLKTLKSVSTSETSTDNGLAEEIKQNNFSDLLPETRKRMERVLKDEKWKDIFVSKFENKQRPN